VKRSHQQEVERIVNLWIDYEIAFEDNECVCKSGKSPQGEIQTYQGDIPRGSAYKPETVSGRADKLKTISLEQFWAKSILFSLHVDERMLVTQWIQLKKKVNTDTRQVFTMREVGLIHGLKIEDYKQKREIASMRLLLLARQMPFRKNQAA